MKRLAKILVIVVVGAFVLAAKPEIIRAVESACGLGSNPNKAGLMLNMHYEDFDRAATLVGKGGWIVELAFPDTGLLIQEQLDKHPDINLVVWGMPGVGSKLDADGWCATLGQLNTNGKKIYFKPWNTANSTSPEDTFAVKGTPKEVAEYQNNLHSCLSKSGLLNNKVILLSPALITTPGFNYEDYFRRIPPEQKVNVARSLFDTWRNGQGVCSSPEVHENACKTREFAKSVEGVYTFAVEGGVANPDINYRDSEQAKLINEMFNPNRPDSWINDPYFIMGALYTRDPINHEVQIGNGSALKAVYEKLRKNGCVPDIQNLAQMTTKFNAWFESVRTSLIACDTFGYSSAKELCNAPPKPETHKVLSFPPLGSVQVCPPEIPVESKFAGEQAEIPPPAEGLCNIAAQEEYTACKDPSLIGKNGNPSDDEWCHGPALIKFCYPKSAADYLAKGGHDCGSGDPTKLGIYGQGFAVSCLGTIEENPWYKSWLAYQAVCINKTRAPTQDDIFKIESDKDKVALCLGYFKNQSIPNKDQSLRENVQGLPACVPTYNAKARCVTECGEPITIDENLQIGQISTTFGQCLASAECRAKINIQNKDGGNAFFLPFAEKLANYFAGILDAEHQSSEELDALQKDLREKVNNQEVMQKLFDQAGVAKKLIPQEIQDKLKCDFIQYVRDRKKNNQNTKYLERIKEGETFKLTGKEFTVFDKNITDISCKPLILTYGGQTSAYEADLASWYNAGMDRYWFAVPLFPDDDSQGEIQFVSPSIFSSQFQPVNVTIPVVQRLAAVTKIIQQALIPSQAITARNSLVESPDPVVRQFALPTYGKEIDPNLFLPNGSEAMACTSQKWENFYSKNGEIIYDKTKNFRLDGQNWTDAQLDNLGYIPSGMSEYRRAVECNIPPLSEASDSKICSIAPNGEITCSVQGRPGSGLTAGTYSEPETVQVRSSFPYLFDIAEQTIGASTGFLQIFKPEAVKQGKVDEFNKAFDPVPAHIDGVYYQLSGSNGRLAIDNSKNKETGWKLYFYKLGGLWQARDFVLDMLNPLEGSGGGPGGR